MFLKDFVVPKSSTSNLTHNIIVHVCTVHNNTFLKNYCIVPEFRSCCTATTLRHDLKHNSHRSNLVVLLPQLNADYFLGVLMVPILGSFLPASSYLAVEHVYLDPHYPHFYEACTLNMRWSAPSSSCAAACHNDICDFIWFETNRCHQNLLLKIPKAFSTILLA